MLIYESNVAKVYREPFTKKVRDISQKLRIDPSWLMQVMYSESRLNPQAVNPFGGASGLIQFMPSTAKALGTSVEAIRNMSALDQLDLVYKYFQPFTGKINSYYDLYLYTFFPAAINKPDSWVFQTSRLPAKLIAQQNPAININKDDKITISEFKEYLRRTVASKYRSIVFSKKAIPFMAVVFAAFFFSI